MENYTKLRVIGKGSYGEVWLVKHKRDRKQYVLKKINLSNASERERHSAEQEAKLLSKLKHPNIVSYKDSFETPDGILYIAMGFCEGGDLYSRLKERKGELLEERQIVEWFVQIAMALQYLHERNILHRDLKTQNIFVTKSKIIKVGDLGIARVLDHASDMANTLIGTPYYMSPELFSNKRYNHKSDVWALGCCVYEMATLKHAFSAKDMNALVYKILRGKMPPMPKQYSEELITLIKSMLNHNPDRRPSVNKILRDPYIRRNITLFLESSKKEKRPVRSHRDRVEKEKSSEIKSRKDVTDGSNGQAQHQKLEAPCQVIAMKDDDVESSKSDSGTLKIKEEISVKDESQISDKRDLPHPLPVPSSKNHDSSKPRVFKPHQSTEDVLVAVDTNSSAKSSVRDVSPQQKHRGSRATRNSVEKLNNSSESSRSQSLENRPGSAGVRRNSKDSDKPPLKSKSPEGRRGSKSVLDNAKIVSKPRPLPYRDPVTPRESNEEPKCSKSSRGAGNGNSKSGYSSGSKYSQDVESSRPNVSARERRRERKDRETPREPVSARSVDLINQRRSLDPGPQLMKPPSSKSADYARTRPAKEIEPIMEEETDESKSVSSRPLIRNQDQQSRKRQPSLDNDSSGTGSGDEDLSDTGQQKENKRKTKPLHSVANLLENNSCQERKISNSGNSDCLHPGRGPVKAFHPYSDSSTHENDLGGEESNGRERDMDNLISALNTTLLMNKRKLSDEDEDDEDDTYPDDVVPEPPGGTKFIHRVPKPSQQQDVDNDVAVLEVESVEGSPDKFNVSICSPKAGVRTMTTTGRLWARITELRKDCIRGLGVEKIKRAYDILDNFDAEDLEPQLVQLLGKKDFDLYSGKIWQLKFCEEAAFGLI